MCGFNPLLLRFLIRWTSPCYLSSRFVTCPHLTPKLGGPHRPFLTGILMMALEVAKVCVHVIDEPSAWIRPRLNAASQIAFPRYLQPVPNVFEKGTYSYVAVGAGTSLG